MDIDGCLSRFGITTILSPIDTFIEEFGCLGQGKPCNEKLIPSKECMEGVVDYTGLEEVHNSNNDCFMSHLYEQEVAY